MPLPQMNLNQWFNVFIEFANFQAGNDTEDSQVSFENRILKNHVSILEHVRLL